jgi:hypothetical protein
MIKFTNNMQKNNIFIAENYLFFKYKNFTIAHGKYLV